jgi:pyruvate dehydrogenase E1 component alpha subunit
VHAYLARTAGVDHDFFDEVEAEADKIAAELRAGCLSMPDPVLTDFFDQVYVEQTPQLVEQKAQFAAYAASFEGEG